jgi:hypothetical protein
MCVKKSVVYCDIAMDIHRCNNSRLCITSEHGRRETKLHAGEDASCHKNNVRMTKVQFLFS